MRPLVMLLVGSLLLSACGDGDQEPVAVENPQTTTSAAPADTSTTTAANPTTTSTGATTTTTLPPLQGLSYEAVASGLPFPTYLTARPGDDVSYLLTKGGRVFALEGGDTHLVLDIEGRVLDESTEQGLLGMALHPEDRERVVLHYTGQGGDTVVSEFRFAPDGTIDPATEDELLRLDQPAPNHNGGMIQFGPDGFLYLGLGDGGGAADQFENAQDTDTLLGGLVRIDVDTGEASLWAYGLRNPWRFWIDSEEDALYIADVGQSAFEEVNGVAFEPSFYNFGWPITEGLHCFSPPENCSTEGLTLPLIEVAHGEAGTCSITGGPVYRGEAIPEIRGHYFYSDYCGGYLRSLRWDGSAVVQEQDWTDQVGVPGQVVSFGVDGSGEMYVLTTDSVLKVVPVR